MIPKTLQHLALIIATTTLHALHAAPAPKRPLPPGAIQLFDGSATVEERRTKQSFANYELHLDYHTGKSADKAVRVHLNNHTAIDLPSAAKWQSAIVTFETVKDLPPIASLWIDDKAVFTNKKVSRSSGASTNGAHIFSDLDSAKAPMSPKQAFTTVTRFRTKTDGTLFAKCNETGKWVPDGKALYVSGGKLVYDIGWLGAISTNAKINDNKWHTVVLSSDTKGSVKIFLDGKQIASKKNFARPDKPGFRLKLGQAGTNFGGDFGGTIGSFSYYKGAWGEAQSKQVSKEGKEGKTQSKALLAWESPAQPQPDPKPINPQPTIDNPVPFVGIPGTPSPIYLEATGATTQIANVWIRPLIDTDAKHLMDRWSEETYSRGEKIYAGLCVTCHGTPEKEGSLPTALKFHEGPFKNGADPISMYRSITYGFGQMMPQAWMTPQQKFDVIHYIREAMIKEQNPSQYPKLDAAYIASLPKVATVPKPKAQTKPKTKPYIAMNYGASLNWTLQIAKPHNIVQKGIMTRLDDGPGGIVKGGAWSIFDHDLMQWSAAWTGDSFVDWRGIAFDGSHGTHTSLKGTPVFINPQAPGWANPATGSWDDPRIKGLKTDRKFGPLPRNWSHYKGTYKHGNSTIIAYTVGDAKLLEQMTAEIVNGKPTVVRTINFTNVTKPLKARIAPTDASIAVQGDGFTIETTNGAQVLTVPANAKSVKIYIGEDAAALKKAAAASPAPTDLSIFTKGGERQWKQSVTTTISRAKDDSAYVVDTLTIPVQNPYNSWMRLSGIDFYPNGSKAAVCTWQGDVWIVDGLNQATGNLTWTRIATGLFQPLGVKIVAGSIYVGCRDQIVKLHDLNGDGETDFYENFNSDHQVTEHFHEFAMGLQTDKDGNFYYAKSACHARPAVVPHHGTLLKVMKDGSSTDILASGFRAANGVCVNPDGSFFVTDQEGHWTPKNRINWVTPGNKFYGNFMGYHNAKSNSDADMEEPMIWLTNKFNRSPGELMWADSDSWGPLKGNLLELSYGMGRIFLNLTETVNGQRQGGQVQLPIPDFDTGVMRGRFSPADGQLYALGMFAWAGNKHAPGNFHRIRYTGKPTYVPTAMRTTKTGIELDFPIALKADSAKQTNQFNVTSWHIKRTKNYGSRHEQEKTLKVSGLKLTNNGRTLQLTIPDITPTRCMSIKATCTASDGQAFKFEINNTIHNLPK